MSTSEGGPADLRRALEALESLRKSLPARERDRPVGELVRNLRSAFELFTEPVDFRPGDLVCWKQGLRNKNYPKDGEPAIVIEKLAVPVYDPGTEAGLPYFREPLDLALGVVDQDGDFLIFHYDSRRFQQFSDDKMPP